MRRTKIVATLGPACDDDAVLTRLIKAGVNLVRLNFSHGSVEDHAARAERVRRISQTLGAHVAILGDLQGPKIRIARFTEGSVQIKTGERFILDAERDGQNGDASGVGIDYKNLPHDVTAGDTLLLDDGRITMEVDAVEGLKVICRVVQGGKLSNNKGINKLGGGLSADALTDKDRADIKTALQLDVDYLAVSFPRSAEDMKEARQLLGEAGQHIGLVAKIERAEAIEPETMDAIIEASDGVMVARGDLGVEIGDAALIGVQKRLIQRARALNKAVITATQMMESMIESPLPTRAEVFDVANAVLDGTDAVMLSAETAVGRYPVETVEAMNRLCLGAENQPSIRQSNHRIHESMATTDMAIAMSAMYAANHLEGVEAIISLTESGNTPRLMSRIRSGLPIVACTRHPRVARRVALYRGVTPVLFDLTDHPREQAINEAIAAVKSHDLVHTGTRVILTHGDYDYVVGGTDTMKILNV